MGSGKGSPEYWVAVVKPGRVMFEIAVVFREEILASLISIYLLLLFGGSSLLLANNGLDSGNIALDLRDLHGIVQLIGGVLHTQEEEVLLRGKSK